MRSVSINTILGLSLVFFLCTLTAAQDNSTFLNSTLLNETLLNETLLNETLSNSTSSDNSTSVNSTSSNSTSSGNSTVPFPVFNTTLPTSIICSRNASDYSIALGLFDSTGLLDRLASASSFTLFIPSNQAFQNWNSQTLGIPVKEIVWFHAIAGVALAPSSLVNDLVINNTLASEIANGTIFMRFNNYSTNPQIFVDGKRAPSLQPLWANIVANCSNGNISIFFIDEVLLPPVAEDQKTILQEILSNPRTSILGQVLQQLINDNDTIFEVLNQTTPGDLDGFTVFAPTNEAFLAIPPGVLDLLLSDPAQLKYFVLNHVLNGTFFSVGLPSGSYPALSGLSLTITRNGSLETGSITVNDANVTTRDIHRLNGVIHLVDQVLTPTDLCLEPRNDGGKTLPSASFWCSQFRGALRPRGYYWSRFTPSQLLSFVTWISRNSDYFSGVTTLSSAASQVCVAPSSLEAATYTLWLNAASGNVLLESQIANFCSKSRFKTYYKKTSYRQYCHRYSYKKVKVAPPTLPSDVTVNNVLNQAEAGLYSSSRTSRSGNYSLVSDILNRQAPGTGGCANTCGPSANAAYFLAAIVDQESSYQETTDASTSLPVGAVVAIAVVVTAVVILSLIGVILFVFRNKVAGLLSKKA